MHLRNFSFTLLLLLFSLSTFAQENFKRTQTQVT